MKVKLPVSWVACGVVEIEALNVEEAIKIFKQREEVDFDLFDIATEVLEKDFVEGTFELNEEYDLIAALNGLDMEGL